MSEALTVIEIVLSVLVEAHKVVGGQCAKVSFGAKRLGAMFPLCYSYIVKAMVQCGQTPVWPQNTHFIRFNSETNLKGIASLDAVLCDNSVHSQGIYCKKPNTYRVLRDSLGEPIVGTPSKYDDACFVAGPNDDCRSLARFEDAGKGCLRLIVNHSVDDQRKLASSICRIVAWLYPNQAKPWLDCAATIDGATVDTVLADATSQPGCELVEPTSKGEPVSMPLVVDNASADKPARRKTKKSK